MSRGYVSYIICMFYVHCKMVSTIEIHKFTYVTYIDIIVNVNGIMLINSNNINDSIIRIF